MVKNSKKSPRPKPSGKSAAKVEPIKIVGTVGESRSRSAQDLIERSIDPAIVQQSYERFLISLQAIVNVPAPKSHFQLEEVEFSAEVTADGEFKLLGTGVGIEAKGGVKFVLRRK